MTWAALSAVIGNAESPLPPQPNSQCDARTRPDWERWLKAEETEMGTCYDKGTFSIVDLPPGVINLKLPSMFQYKLKTGHNGEVVKCEARLCARGDLQFDSEFGETFAPTSRFSMV